MVYQENDQKLSRKQIPKGRMVGHTFLLALWLMFAAWQHKEYVRQCELIDLALISQAEALSGAVSSSVLSHRWFSPFVRQQLPETLSVLARSKNVIAIVLVVNEDTDNVFVAGKRDRANHSLPVGQHVQSDTLQFVSSFVLRNDPPMMHGQFPDSAEHGEADAFKSIVVLDRSGTITQINREFRNRILLFAVGTLLLLSLAAVWQFTVRLAQSEGTTRLLKAETRHLRELGQAAAGLAHETRNPLGLIRGWTQRLVEAGLPTDDQQQQAEAVLEECDRVTARINQFLAFARQADLRIESVIVAETVHELQSLLKAELDDRNLSLDSAGCSDVSAIEADRDQLRQVLFNLLQNAIAFAPDSSTITIRMRPSKPQSFQLEIIDQGPGVAEEISESLFEPYVTRRPRGTGLGLSIVRRIAAAHDWNVGYKRGTNGGSIFWIDGLKIVE